MKLHLLPLVVVLLVVQSVSGAAAENGKPGVLTMSEAEAYDAAFAVFAEGRQSDAEEMVRQRLERFPRERRMRFFHATLLRSRFYKREPAVEFQRVVRADGKDAYAAVGLTMVRLDAHQEPEQNFARMRELVERNPKEPLFLWLAAIACREHERNEEGIGYYRKLCEQVKPGGSLIHQTFANLLDQTGEYKEALLHREIVVTLEPASWSYNGLGNTLRNLERYEEASNAHEEAAKLEPEAARNWAQWADAEQHLKRFESASTKYRTAIRLGYSEVWVYLGYAKSQLGCKRPAEAKLVLEQGIAALPDQAESMRELLEQISRAAAK